MLMLLSPAKSLDYTSPVPELLMKLPMTAPDYLHDSALLIQRLRELAPAEVAELMGISDALAVLNVTRYMEWEPPFTTENAKAAVLAFNGDVYEGLAANTLNTEDLAFAQNHLRILSGLYGLLRPLDLMQAYRLEMGTKLSNPRGKDLYAFWDDKLSLAINQLQAGEAAPVLLNLASAEYFKAIKTKKLRARVVQPVFEDWKGGKYKIVSFYAKRARGLMARYVIENRLSDPAQLVDFDVEGYQFVPAASDESTLVFRRKLTELAD